MNFTRTRTLRADVRVAVMTLAAVFGGGACACADIGSTAGDEITAIAARPLLKNAPKTAFPDGGFSYASSYRGDPVDFHYELGPSKNHVVFEYVIYRGKTAAVKFVPGDAAGKRLLNAVLSQEATVDFEAAHLIKAVTNVAAQTSSEIFEGARFGYAVNHTAGYTDGNSELDVIEKRSIPVALRALQSLQ